MYPQNIPKQGSRSIYLWSQFYAYIIHLFIQTEHISQDLLKFMENNSWHWGTAMDQDNNKNEKK